MSESPIVLESAGRHGINEDDVLNAYQHAYYIVETQDDFELYVGPSRSGYPVLEIGVIHWHGVIAINHAMPVRAKYLR